MMKIVLIFVWTLFLYSSIFAQKMNDESKQLELIQTLTLENDSLKRTLKVHRKTHKDSLKALNRRLVFAQSELEQSEKVIENHRKELNIYSNNDEQLRDSIKNLHDSLELVASSIEVKNVEMEERDKKLDKLQKNIQENIEEIDTIRAQLKEINKKRTSLQDTIGIKVAIIRNLKDSIDQRDKKIKELLNDIEPNRQAAFSSGRESILQELSATYNQSLDELIIKMTPQILQRDSAFLNESKFSSDKIKKLSIYFSAKGLLKKKFDEKSVESTLMQLKKITESNFAKELQEDLSQYSFYNRGLIITIENLIDLDKVTTSKGDEDKLKLKRIFNHLSEYIFYSEINYESYPYLSARILELMDRKRDNPDSPINDILDKL